MTTHISARLAWHDNGWNGHVCNNPAANTYCVGQHSYPGHMIAEQRDLAREAPVAGCAIGGLEGYTPPCIYSVNAFGSDNLTSYAKPPTFFNDDSHVRYWSLPPSTVCIWPYEVMYTEDVTLPGGNSFDYEKRLANAKEFFSHITPDHSLIFYYANYSNPFSENESRQYVVVGVSRVKALSDIMYFENASERVRQRYAGAFVWQTNVTSHYPDQGLRIPYHRYMDQPDILERIMMTPENPRHFKFATRDISDDGALSLVERLTEIVGVLQEIGDTTESWRVRQDWLASVMAELWQHRGLFPGLARVWDYLKFGEAVQYTIHETGRRSDVEVKDAVFGLLEGTVSSVPGLSVDPRRIQAVRKRWQLLEPSQQQLLRDVLPRHDLQTRQIEKILQAPESASVYASHAEIVENPYLLSEQYVGQDPDDQITFSQIDHGMFPSPELGSEPEFEVDDWPRLRALSVEQLQRNNQHTFLLADQIIHDVNHRLSFLPEWKRAQFTPRHLEVERKDLSAALTYRNVNDQLYLYLKSVFDDERLAEATLRELAQRSDITLRFPVTESHWQSYLYDPSSELAQLYPSEYDGVIASQVAVCQQIFRRPISVLCGSAGTGKTTVVKAIIQAIEKAHGTGTSFQLLAPTGKAADRLRERTGKEAATMHSFLAKHGWLNDNMTFRRGGGQRAQSITTFIIDESSMLDLPLLATFFRAVNWNSVQRLIFVGDPNQLPPIGTGKVFADLIDWLRDEMPEHVGELTANIRQLRNSLTGQGTGILDLASIYVRKGLTAEKSADDDAAEERTLAQVQEGGDVSGDLRVLYWQTPDELHELLVATIVSDMEADCGETLDPQRPDKLWEAHMRCNDNESMPEVSQVISPYRGELFGVEHLNRVLQRHKNSWLLDNKGELAGITYRDKVIQIRNRPRSNPIWAYNTETRKNEKIVVYNGEIGLTKVHGFDHTKWTWSNFHLSRFQVVFSRKQDWWVGYQSNSDVEGDLELAYAISVHKSQGSEFRRVYFVLPKHKRGLLSRELFYTGITRAQTHCTLLVQEDISPILSLRRLENSHLTRINSSLFRFRPVPREYQTMRDWYEEGKIHRTLAEQMVRSKSEVIIANMLFDRDIPFLYELPLYAPDGTFYLPDFTLTLRGETWYWEHLGMLHSEEYRNHWETKRAWYAKHGFEDRLITTMEGPGFDSTAVRDLLLEYFGI